MPTIQLIQFFTAFAITFSMVFLLNPIAKRFQLVDKPDKQRKKHSGHIPLTGGISIYFSLLLCSFLFYEATYDSLYFLLASGLLVLSGVLDDRFHLSVSLRIATEVIAASIMVFGARVWIGVPRQHHVDQIA